MCLGDLNLLLHTQQTKDANHDCPILPDNFLIFLQTEEPAEIKALDLPDHL